MNKLAHGPAYRVNGKGDVVGCETTHHDFRPDQMDGDDSYSKNQKFRDGLRALRSMRLTPTERRRKMFELIAERYNHIAIKVRIDSTSEWAYQFELSGITYRGREWLRDGEVTVTNYGMVRSALKKLPIFRKSPGGVLKAYFNYLRYECAEEATRRFERPLTEERGTVRIKSNVSSERDRWVQGMIDKGWMRK